MIETLETVALYFYQRKMENGKSLFIKNLGELVDIIEKSGSMQAIQVLNNMLESEEKSDYILLADQILYDLIPVLKEI